MAGADAIAEALYLVNAIYHGGRQLAVGGSVAHVEVVERMEYLSVKRDPAAGREFYTLTYLSLYWNQITDIAPLSALTSLTRLYLRNNPGEFSDSDETVVLLKSRGCSVHL
eukprot:SAG22_NODE_1263_length_4967_cov_5.836278_4_plen_111_part_00